MLDNGVSRDIYMAGEDGIVSKLKVQKLRKLLNHDICKTTLVTKPQHHSGISSFYVCAVIPISVVVHGCVFECAYTKKIV